MKISLFWKAWLVIEELEIVQESLSKIIIFQKKAETFPTEAP